MRSYREWRVDVAHASKYRDPITGKSLASRVCAGDAGLEISNAQVWLCTLRPAHIPHTSKFDRQTTSRTSQTTGAWVRGSAHCACSSGSPLSSGRLVLRCASWSQPHRSGVCLQRSKLQKQGRITLYPSAAIVWHGSLESKLCALLSLWYGAYEQGKKHETLTRSSAACRAWATAACTSLFIQSVWRIFCSTVSHLRCPCPHARTCTVYRSVCYM